MKYDITHALQALKPGAEWSLDGEDMVENKYYQFKGAW